MPPAVVTTKMAPVYDPLAPMYDPLAPGTVSASPEVQITDCCSLSTFYCLRCLLSTVFAVYFLLSSLSTFYCVRCLLSTVYSLLSAVHFIRSTLIRCRGVR
jgi:hypothetical protein